MPSMSPSQPHQSSQTFFVFILFQSLCSMSKWLTAVCTRYKWATDINLSSTPSPDRRLSSVYAFRFISQDWQEGMSLKLWLLVALHIVTFKCHQRWASGRVPTIFWHWNSRTFKDAWELCSGEVKDNTVWLWTMCEPGQMTQWL